MATRCEHQGQCVHLEAKRAGQAGKELLAVLNANPVDKHHESQGAKQRRGRRIGRQHAHAETNEQHRTDAQVEAPDVHLANGVSQPDDQKHREQDLLFEKCSENFHNGVSYFALFASSSARMGTPRLQAWIPWATQILRTSMISSIVTPSFSAVWMCRRVPGAYM